MARATTYREMMMPPKGIAVNEDLTTQDLKLLVRDDGVLCAFPLAQADDLLKQQKEEKQKKEEEK